MTGRASTWGVVLRAIRTGAAFAVTLTLGFLWGWQARNAWTPGGGIPIDGSPAPPEWTAAVILAAGLVVLGSMLGEKSVDWGDSA